ncbi:MAG: hypothetical protein K6G80_11920 [Treponema sp.]|nr:hypothetical protein [Treponema sp.]
MKKIVGGFAAALLAIMAAAALEVNKSELQLSDAKAEAIQFENYAGPHAVVETADAIRSIGRNLGKRVAQAPEEAATYDPEGKYTLVHAVDSSAPGKYDADIFVLNSSAGVDHINNLRRIIAGFLEEAYGYSGDDADTISVFITIYNAVYRGDIATFSEKYKDVVTAAITESKSGLSTNWQDWAGGTQIVIPLGTSLDGTPAGVETSAISDDRVIEALRKEDDHALETREKLNEIKERESGDAAQNAKNAQKDAAQKKQEGDKAGAAKSAQTASEQQQLADKKRGEVQAEDKALADDKRALDAQAQPDEASLVTGLFSADNKGSLYTLVTVDGATGKVVRRSDLKHIRSAVVYAVDGMYLAVCGENKGKAAVRLCLIDSTSLEIAQESKETLSESSPLVSANGGWYAIVQEGGTCYAALFDKTLTMKYRSDVPVSPATPFNQTAQGVLVSEPNGKPHLLDAGNLSTIW